MTAPDPILGLIAEFERLDRLATPIRARADTLWFALPEEVKKRAPEGEGHGSRAAVLRGRGYRGSEGQTVRPCGVYEGNHHRRANRSASISA
jgi:hypothetical protein